MRQRNSRLNDLKVVQKEYSKMALAYDRKWKFYLERSLLVIFERIKINSGEHLLDVGCGTGILLSMLAKAHPNISLAGVDLTKGMLKIARNRLSKEVELKEGEAEALPFEDTTFDLVISSSMFHYIRRPEVALAEAKRVLKVGGKLVITDWCADYFSVQLLSLFLEIFNAAHFKTYRMREIHSLLVEAGFKEVSIEKYRINWLWGLMTISAKKGEVE